MNVFRCGDWLLDLIQCPGTSDTVLAHALKSDAGASRVGSESTCNSNHQAIAWHCNAFVDNALGKRLCTGIASPEAARPCAHPQQTGGHAVFRQEFAGGRSRTEGTSEHTPEHVSPRSGGRSNLQTWDFTCPCHVCTQNAWKIPLPPAQQTEQRRASQLPEHAVICEAHTALSLLVCCMVAR